MRNYFLFLSFFKADFQDFEKSLLSPVRFSKKWSREGTTKKCPRFMTPRTRIQNAYMHILVYIFIGTYICSIMFVCMYVCYVSEYVCGRFLSNSIQSAVFNQFLWNLIEWLILWKTEPVQFLDHIDPRRRKPGIMQIQELCENRNLTTNFGETHQFNGVLWKMKFLIQ